MQVEDLEVRVRLLCERAVSELEIKTSLTKDAIQMLESVNKMITVFYDRDANRTEENPLTAVDTDKLMKQFEHENI